MHSMIIIEDHPVMRRGLTAYFAGSERWRVLGSAASLDDAKALLSRDKNLLEVDIILLDIQLGTEWGLDLITWLREYYKENHCGGKTPPVVIYSAFSDYTHVSAALGLGVRGYVCKTHSEAELESALETVLKGEIYIDKAVQQKLTIVADTISLLTRRESEILTLVRSGLSNRDIAEQLGLSRRTVENILSCIYDKTGIPSRLDLQKM
jgi:DNA-binding NarL/FixJ family response regulator